jgi:hypothetical protein
VNIAELGLTHMLRCCFLFFNSTLPCETRMQHDGAIPHKLDLCLLQVSDA